MRIDIWMRITLALKAYTLAPMGQWAGAELGGGSLVGPTSTFPFEYSDATDEERTWRAGMYQGCRRGTTRRSRRGGSAGGGRRGGCAPWGPWLGPSATSTARCGSPKPHPAPAGQRLGGCLSAHKHKPQAASQQDPGQGGIAVGLDPQPTLGFGVGW